MSYESEEQQVEALKAWWAENGRAIIVGLVLGAGAIGGWGLWQRHGDNQAMLASERFSQALAAMNADDDAAVATAAAELIDDQGGSLYAAYGQLAAARAAVNNDDLDTAATHLQWVIDESGREDVALIAAVRLARVEIARDAADEALSRLPESYPESYTGLVEEVRGDALLASGDAAAARAAYLRAQGSQNVVNPTTLAMKIADLAVPADAS